VFQLAIAHHKRHFLSRFSLILRKWLEFIKCCYLQFLTWLFSDIHTSNENLRRVFPAKFESCEASCSTIHYCSKRVDSVHYEDQEIKMAAAHFAIRVVAEDRRYLVIYSTFCFILPSLENNINDRDQNKNKTVLVFFPFVDKKKKDKQQQRKLILLAVTILSHAPPSKTLLN